MNLFNQLNQGIKKKLHIVRVLSLNLQSSTNFELYSLKLHRTLELTWFNKIQTQKVCDLQSYKVELGLDS